MNHSSATHTQKHGILEFGQNYYMQFQTPYELSIAGKRHT